MIFANLQTDSIQLTIDLHAQVFWNGALVHAATLANRMLAAVQLALPPGLHISADRAVPFEKLAQTMSLATRQGLSKFGFIPEAHRP